MVVVMALGSALFYAAAAVLQHRSAAEAPAEECLRPTLLVRLFRHPIWLLGIAADLAGLVLQFWALGHGPMSLVQPLLVSGLLFALPMGALAARRRIPVGDLVGAAAIVVGLGLFLGVARPGAGRAASGMAWAFTAACVAVPTAAIAGSVATGRPLARNKAPALAVAAGITYGFAAALVEATAHLVEHHGYLHALASWQPYALLIAGAVTLLLAQSAFQAGPLADSLPLLTVVDPVVSVLIGGVLLRESIAHSAGAVLLEVVGAAIMTAGIMIDGRSELLEASSAAEPA